MKTTTRNVRLRTRQTRKARAVVIKSGATESEMRKMNDLRKRGAAAATTTPSERGSRARLRAGSAGRSIVPASEARREADVLRRTRTRLRTQEKGRPTGGADRKTSLE